MSYSYTASRQTNNTNNTKCCGKRAEHWNSYMLLVGIQNGSYTVKQFVVRCLVKLNIHLPHDQAIHSIYPRNMKTQAHTNA